MFRCCNKGDRTHHHFDLWRFPGRWITVCVKEESRRRQYLVMVGKMDRDKRSGSTRFDVSGTLRDRLFIKELTRFGSKTSLMELCRYQTKVIVKDSETRVMIRDEIPSTKIFVRVAHMSRCYLCNITRSLIFHICFHLLKQRIQLWSKRVHA